MKGLDIVGRVLGQFTSGRWLVTLAAAYCFILLTRTLCWMMEQGKITLEASTYVAIVMSILNTVGMVTVFYFQKQRPDINGNGDSETTTLPPKP
jgi:hypothetical protein